MASKQSCLVIYDKIRVNIPKQTKVSPIAAILHKYKAFILLLYLLFSLRLAPQGSVPFVNEKSEKMAPGGAIDQIGHVILRLICAFTEAPECAKIFQEK